MPRSVSSLDRSADLVEQFATTQASTGLLGDGVGLASKAIGQVVAGLDGRLELVGEPIRGFDRLAVEPGAADLLPGGVAVAPASGQFLVGRHGPGTLLAIDRPVELGSLGFELREFEFETAERFVGDPELVLELVDGRVRGDGERFETFERAGPEREGFQVDARLPFEPDDFVEICGKLCFEVALGLDLSNRLGERLGASEGVGADPLAINAGAGVEQLPDLFLGVRASRLQPGQILREPLNPAFE